MVQGEQKPINKVRSQTIKHHPPPVNFLLNFQYQMKPYFSSSLNMEHPDQKWQHFISINYLSFKTFCCLTQKYHKPEPPSNVKILNTKIMKKIL